MSVQTRVRASAFTVALFIFLALPQVALACVPAPTANPRTPTAIPRPTDTPDQAARKQAQEVRDTFRTADIVFRGNTARTETFASGTFLGSTATSLRAFFTVDTVWKGSIGQQVTVYSRRTDISDCDITAGDTGPRYPLRSQATYLVYARLDKATQTYEISMVTNDAAIATDIGVLGPGTPVAASPATPIATPAATTVAVAASPITTTASQPAAVPPAPAQTESSGRSSAILFLVAGSGMIAAALAGFAFGRSRRRA